jgi:hypothetical protein
MTLPANIRVNVRVPFPALVQGGAFVTVAKANGIWSITPNYNLLAPAPAVTPTQLIAVQDANTGVWNTVTATELQGGGAGGALLAANNLSDVASKTASFNNLSPMTTPGDIIYGGASGAGTRLPAGTSSQVLFGGATPSWGSPPASGTVATMAALEALPTSNGTVELTQPGRAGRFNWVAGNLVTQVANDPAYAISVPTANDMTNTTVITITGTLSPDNTGTYVYGGQFGGRAYYVGGNVPAFIKFASIGLWYISATLGPDPNLNEFFATGTGTNPPLTGWTAAGTYTGTPTLSVPGGFVAAVPGTSGAWVRQYTGKPSLAWFGYLGDASFDNSTAMNSFGIWARSQSGGVSVFWPPGIYNFVDNQNYVKQWLYGIRNLDIEAYGVTMQGTGVSTLDPMGGSATNANLHAGQGYLIATTAVNQTTVTCLTPSQAGNFVNGSAAVVMSLDIQYFGFPPNCAQFDYVTVTGANASTGVVTFANDSLRYIHRSDFPDGPAAGSLCGKARIWLLDAVDTLPNALPIPWNVQHVYRGLTINATNQTRQSFNGLSIKLVDVNICGISPTVCKNFNMQGGSIFNESEPDKLVDLCELTSVRVTGIFNFQSGSFNNVKFRGCYFSILQTGNARNVTIDDCQLLSLSNSGFPYGKALNLLIINSLVKAYFYAPISFTADQSLTLDQNNTSYANGVFTILNSDAFGNQFAWNVQPGQEIILRSVVLGSGNLPFTADRAVGYVMSLADTGSGATAAIAITTTLPYATLPGFASFITAVGSLVGGSGGTPGTYNNVPFTGGSGSGAIAVSIVVGAGGGVTTVNVNAANGGNGYAVGDVLSAASGNIGGVTGFSVHVTAIGSIFINRYPRVKVINSTGCDSILQLSELSEKGSGYLPGQWYRNVLMGINSQNTSFSTYVGELIEIDVNVIQVDAIASATWALTGANAPAYPAFTSPANLVITIDTTILGKRTFTLAALTGKVGNDAVTLGGTTQTALPAVWVNGLTAAFNTNPAGHTLLQRPIIEVIMKFDIGNIGKIIPAYKDAAGTGVVVGITGSGL